MRACLALLAFTAPICACSGSEVPSSALSSSGMSTAAFRSVPGRTTGAGRDVTPTSISSKDLFVGVESGGAYEVLIVQNGTFRVVGEIKPGIYDPAGSWVDSHGLYIANDHYYYREKYKLSDVAEYSSPNARPFVYGAHILMPDAVTTDSSGNVYESDAGGWVNEYAQKSNKVKATCSPPSGTPWGVAVDNVGDVFVAYTSDSGVGQIQEISDFGTCFGTTLGVKLNLASGSGGMALDRSNNVIICEPGKKTVDVIKPPYNKVSVHLGSGYKYPWDVTINGANNRVWLVDAEAGVVYDLYYPSGKVVKKLYATSDTSVLSAVDGSNYVP
jgi:hypothetical protein